MIYFQNALVEKEICIRKNIRQIKYSKKLQELGLTLNEIDLKKVTQRVIELGDRKERVTAEDLPFIISDVLGNNVPDKVKINSYVLTHSKALNQAQVFL